MRPRTASTSACSALPFSTARASCFSILPSPASSRPWSTSRTTTSMPAWAQTWAIPWPMRPQPRTPTLLISIRDASRYSIGCGPETGRAAYSGSSAEGQRGAHGGLRRHARKLEQGIDRGVDLHRQVVDLGERLGIRIEAEEGAVANRCHADRERVTVGDRDHRIGLDQRAAAHVELLPGPG